MRLPYRKFAASPGWLAAGPLVHNLLDDTAGFSGLDARIIDAERAGAPLVFGWLQYLGDELVRVVAEPTPGTSADFASWLDPLVDSWAWTERVQIAPNRPRDWIGSEA